jgi:hypothetical protein
LPNSIVEFGVVDIVAVKKACELADPSSARQKGTHLNAPFALTWSTKPAQDLLNAARPHMM